MFEALGQQPTDEEVYSMIAEVDQDGRYSSAASRRKDFVGMTSSDIVSKN